MTTHTYIARHIFDERKLKQRTLLEFSRAMEYDRLVVMTGSMSSQSFGYPDWSKLRKIYFQCAMSVLKDLKGSLPSHQYSRARKAIEAVEEQSSTDGGIDKRVALSVTKEALRNIESQWPRLKLEEGNFVLTPTEALERRFAKEISANRTPREEENPEANSLLKLIHGLGIERFVTLNYDLELERAMMVPSCEEQDLNENDTTELFSKLLNTGRIVEASGPLKRLRRILDNGRIIESDIFSRARSDRLLEFAIGSSQVDRHILHLHGRIDAHETLVVGSRDYDKLYRRTDPSLLSFEQALRVLFAGNPILFIGIGMTETEVNATLETFVSDNPYKYSAPLFLLWNSFNMPLEAEERRRAMQAKRLDLLTRLGVFVIFDEDLKKEGLLESVRFSRQGPFSNAKEIEDQRLELLAQTVDALAEGGSKVRARTRNRGEKYRSMKSRVREGQGKVKLWCNFQRPCGTAPKLEPEWGLDSSFPVHSRANTLSAIYRPMAIVGPAGSGKGLLANTIIEDSAKSQFSSKLLINVSFCYDTDSLVDPLIRFMRQLHEPKLDYIHRSRASILASENIEGVDNFLKPRNSGLIVLNGVDRFFTPSGIPLSAEFDRLIRIFSRIGNPDAERRTEGRVKLVLLGTERVSNYLDALKVPTFHWNAQAGPTLSGKSIHKQSRYLAEVNEAFERASHNADVFPPGAAKSRYEAALRTPTNNTALRRAALANYLSMPKLGQCGCEDPRLATAVLRTMAFIGMPVEAIVLLHAPAVRDLLLPDEYEDAECLEGKLEVAAGRLEALMLKLRQLKLIIEFMPFEDYPDSKGIQPEMRDGERSLWRRYGLHRTVLAELRERFGIPLSQTKRATAFNLTLYFSQPVNGDTPDPSLHSELGRLVDNLLGIYRDAPVKQERTHAYKNVLAAAIRTEKNENFPPLDDTDVVLGRLTAPAQVAALRAALSVIRGYFSTTTLLAVDRGAQLAGLDKDGVLLDHAERLERLLRCYRKVTRFREGYVKQMVDQYLAAMSPPDRPYLYDVDGKPIPFQDREVLERKARDEAAQRLGPEPFYRDELVWLYNELGVVRLAQGDLYLARTAFDMALQLNSKVEFDDRSFNWRRIMLNVILLEIERGRLDDAQQHIGEIEMVINREGAASTKTRVEEIIDAYGSDSDDGKPRAMPNAKFEQEDILSTALLLSLKAITAHVQGHLVVAKGYYRAGLSIFRQLDEHRAIALFQRYYAQLSRTLGDKSEFLHSIKLSVAAAESARQLDLAYPSRMLKAEGMEQDFSEDFLRQAQVAYEYSVMTDMPRVRVEASIRLARAKKLSGDHETAFAHATEAATIAARFGMALRKVSVRVLLGQIMIARGNARAGLALIDSAIEEADSLGYQRGMALAEHERSLQAIPSDEPV